MHTSCSFLLFRSLAAYVSDYQLLWITIHHYKSVPISRVIVVRTASQKAAAQFGSVLQHTQHSENTVELVRILTHLGWLYVPENLQHHKFSGLGRFHYFSITLAIAWAHEYRWGRQSFP